MEVFLLLFALLIKVKISHVRLIIVISHVTIIVDYKHCGLTPFLQGNRVIFYIINRTNMHA